VFVFYAYPGVMTMDSFDQLKEGRAWFFTDAHPPIMAVIWGIVDRFLAGPFGMLVIQSASFLAGLYLILRRAMRPRVAALCACGLFLFPPVLAPMAVVWKDCVMAGLLVLAVPAVLDERRAVRLLGLAAFTLATAMRYNAAAATFPLIVLLWHSNHPEGRRWYARYALALGVWLVSTLLAFGLNAALTDRKMYFWYSSMALADIAGTLAHVDRDIPDSELAPVLAPTHILADSNLHLRIRAKYRSDDFQQLLSGEGHLWDVNINGTIPTPAPQREAIGKAWWHVVTTYPGAFASYRLENFGETLGVNKKFSGAVVVPHRAQYVGMLDYMNIGRGTSSFQIHTENATMWVAKKTRLFRPHFYALLALALLWFARRQRDVLALLLSGLFMELSLLLLGGTPDYRYSHWLVTCTCIAVVMLIARRIRSTD